MSVYPRFRTNSMIATSAFLLASTAALLAEQKSNETTIGLGPPAVYEELQNAEPQSFGHIRDGRLRIDRFEFELSDGDLYLVPVSGRTPISIYIGHGLVRAYPPNGVEHQQLRKLIDEDFLEEEFTRFVFWSSGSVNERLQSLTDDTPGRQIKKAADLLSDRRKNLLEQQLSNPDSRLLMSLWRPDDDSSPPSLQSSYFYAEIDSRDHDWFSIEVEPFQLEEVSVARFRRRYNLNDIWMGTHAVTDFGESSYKLAFAGFQRDPEKLGPVNPDKDTKGDWDYRDFGLQLRPDRPEYEQWNQRVNIARTDVDIALKSNGDATASISLLVEALEPLATIRLQISSVLEATDVRWRTTTPIDADDVRAVNLLQQTDPSGETNEPEKPTPISGEPLHFVQEKHSRRMRDDRYEPWLTIMLPRQVKTGELFLIDIAYEGELVERLRSNQEFVLKDTIHWIPRHPHNRRSKFNLTFRVPERYRIASGGFLEKELVEGNTRILQWLIDQPVRGTMAFHYGQFEVDEVSLDDLPSISIYANRHHRGFSPGAREKTLEDLIGSIRTYSNYFGPYPFDSLLVTETQNSGGQAFPGLVLLTFQAFGGLHTGEEELFRSHEVAHQWWGASVDWENYRDQWITEGFANYSAALYSLVGLGDEDQFLDMLDAWRLDVLGEINIGQGIGLKRYGFRPAVIRESDGHQSGPLVAGFRLQTVDTPFDYRLIVYEKGAFILHMLRMLLIDFETGSDAKFKELMRSFMRTHAGGVANTAAFEVAVTKAFGEPMDWFFDQWVYGTDVPVYRPELTVSQLSDAESPFILHGSIRQERVPSDFRMPVPIHLEFETLPPQIHRIWVNDEKVNVEIPIPEKPTNVTFNFQHAVLAHID